MYLSVVVPVYNEAITLTKNISYYLEYLQQQNYDFEIILVIDGSTDNSLSSAQDLGKKFSEISIINFSQNQGKGEAVRQGLLRAKGEYRLFLDADNATDISHLDKVWPEVKDGADIVIGSRNHRDAPGALQAVPQAGWKQVLGKMGNLIIQALTVPGIWDTQCGFKLLSAQATNEIIPQTISQRWTLDIEILLIARRKNLKIKIIPVLWLNSDYSRVKLKGYCSALGELIKIKCNLLQKKYK